MRSRTRPPMSPSSTSPRTRLPILRCLELSPQSKPRIRARLSRTRSTAWSSRAATPTGMRASSRSLSMPRRMGCTTTRCWCSPTATRPVIATATTRPTAASSRRSTRRTRSRGLPAAPASSASESDSLREPIPRRACRRSPGPRRTATTTFRQASRNSVSSSSSLLRASAAEPLSSRSRSGHRSPAQSRRSRTTGPSRRR